MMTNEERTLVKVLIAYQINERQVSDEYEFGDKVFITWMPEKESYAVSTPDFNTLMTPSDIEDLDAFDSLTDTDLFDYFIEEIVGIDNSENYSAQELQDEFDEVYPEWYTKLSLTTEGLK